jgi:hypothetical protein
VIGGISHAATSLPPRPCYVAMMRIALLLAAIAFGGCHRGETRAEAAGVSKKVPGTAAECRACNGEWGVHGLVQVESCLCRTHDVGRRCRDGIECEGECIVQPGVVEVTDQGPPRRGYFVGKCSEFDHLFGCLKLLMDGTAARGPSALDEPPGEVCID